MVLAHVTCSLVPKLDTYRSNLYEDKENKKEESHELLSFQCVTGQLKLSKDGITARRVVRPYSCVSVQHDWPRTMSEKSYRC